MPSAAVIASRCFARHSDIVGFDLDPVLEWDLEALAEHFVQNDNLPFFINTVVPWADFAKPINAGHAAIADLLLCKAARAAISTNYDILIERYAWDQNAGFQAAFTGDEAGRATDHSPLLKPHGCEQICRQYTVWAPSQLGQGEIATRLLNSQNWLRPLLREKDLLIIGFWSDWRYLNKLIADALEDAAPASITLVDPDNAAVLEEKAGRLWAIAHAEGISFRHVQAPGEVFLDEFRKAFSQSWLRAMLRGGRQAFAAEMGADPAAALFDIDGSDMAALYDRRRDAEGIAPGHAPRGKRPPPGEVLGFVHLLLRYAGAIEKGASYDHDGRSIRVVNGNNRILAGMRAEHPDPPSIAAPDVVVCVGALDTGQPGNLVRAGRPRDFMRPTSTSRWMTVHDARQELGF